MPMHHALKALLGSVVPCAVHASALLAQAPAADTSGPVVRHTEYGESQAIRIFGRETCGSDWAEALVMQRAQETYARTVQR